MDADGQDTRAATFNATLGRLPVGGQAHLLNEMETNRHGVRSWAKEQTIREIYLPAFELAAPAGPVQV